MRRMVTDPHVSPHPAAPVADVPLSAHASALQLRLAARAGRLDGHTSSLAAAHVQADLVVLPAALAADFQLFCERNPVACPLLAVSAPGQITLPTPGADLDLRTDLPRYQIWRRGERRVAEVGNVRSLWRADLVSFALGCSFSFEHALLAHGIPLRHVQQGRNVAMYRSTLATQSAGVFEGPVVVSMRPMNAAHAIRAVQITSALPLAHSAPLHLGDPALIGIADLSRPDCGDAIEVRPDELPVFWACGFTPQAAIAHARPDLCITHAPGHMLVADLLHRDQATLQRPVSSHSTLP
jgi:uncharacterized protein YcsI (UPF0317 family)